MRNKQLLLGIGAAVIVAVAIVAVGALARSGDQTAGQPSAQQSLPPGHPDVSESEPTSTTAATTSSSVQRSIKELEKSRKADPANVPVLLKLGDAYFLAQRYAQAEKTFRDALRVKPADPTATVRLAMVWHAGGQTQRALKAIEGVLRAQPGDQEAHYSLAIIYFSQERVQEARDEWAKAASIDPTSTIGRRSQNFVQLIDGSKSQSQGD